MQTENVYSHAIIGRYSTIGDMCWIKFNKYKTLQFAEQALKDMTKNIKTPSHELKIVPYFQGYIFKDNFIN